MNLSCSFLDASIFHQDSSNFFLLFKCCISAIRKSTLWPKSKIHMKIGLRLIFSMIFIVIFIFSYYTIIGQYLLPVIIILGYIYSKTQRYDTFRLPTYNYVCKCCYVDLYPHHFCSFFGF